MQMNRGYGCGNRLPNCLMRKNKAMNALMTIGKLNKMELLQKSRFSRSSGGLVLFEMLALLLLLLLLVLADMLCYQQALSVVLDEQAGHATLSVGSETVPLGF